MAGITTPNFPLASDLDEVLGHTNVGGILSNARTKKSAIVGPLQAQIDTVASKITDSSADLKSAQAAITGLASTVAQQASAISTLQTGQTSASVVFETWTELAAHPATAAGARGEVSNDAGTHTDPVNGATGVANTGVYSWSTSPAGWKRIGDSAYSALSVSAAAAKSKVDAVARSADSLTPQASETPSVISRIPDSDVNQIPNGSFFGTGYYGWGFAKRLNAAAYVDAIEVQIRDVSGTGATIEAKTYLLPTSHPTSLPSSNPLSVAALIATQFSVAADVFGPRRLTSGDVSTVRIPLNAGFLPSGSDIIVTLALVDAGSTLVQMDAAIRTVAGGEPAWISGLARGGVPAFAFTPVAAGYAPWSRLVTSRSSAIPRKAATIAGLYKTVEREGLRNRADGGQWLASANYTNWAVLIRPSRTMRINAFAPTVFNMNLATSIAYRVYRRAVTTYNGPAPGTDPTDEIVFSGSSLVASIVADPSSSAAQEMRLDLSSVPSFSPNYAYFVEWNARGAAGELVATGLATATGPSDNLDTRCAWYSTGTGPRTYVPSPYQASFALYEDAPEPLFAGYNHARATLRTANLASTIVAGRTIVTPAAEMSRLRGSLIVQTKGFNVADIASESMSETVVLLAGQQSFLSRKFVSGLTLTNQSGGAVLTLGADYVLDPKSGRIDSIGANATCTAAYIGYKTRYDRISVNRTTGAVTLTQGTARGIDPEEYKPTIPAGDELLYDLFVYPGFVEMIPVHEWRDGTRVTERTHHAEWLEHCRKRIPKTLKKLRTGAAIRLGGYGDSLTQILNLNGTFDPLTNVAGEGRDGIDFFQRMPTDTRAAIPRFDNGLGVGTGVRLGWNWYLKAAMEARYGSTVTYRNWGAGGTTSGTGNASNGYANGRDAARLAALIGDGPDLVPLAFGTNETGNAGTYGNLVAIIQAIQGAGGEVIVLTPPMLNANAVVSLDAMQITHDACVNAAVDTGSAFVSTWELFAPGNEGSTGLSRNSLSASNSLNHCGRAEFAAIGNHIARIIP